METISTNNNAQQVVSLLKSAFGSGIVQDLSVNDSATDFVDKVNANFDAISSGGGSATFPANTILPSAIGSLEQGEDIGGMTIADFIKYGINGATKKFSFLHYSDAHGSYQSTGKAASMVNPSSNDYDAGLSFALYTGDGIDDTAMASANNGKHLLIMGNHDANDKYNRVYADMTAALKGFISNGGVTYGDNNEAYWHKDFPLVGGGKVRLFGTCEYQWGTGDGASTYTPIVRQNQVDWLIAKLDELNDNDYIIVATHKPPFNGGKQGITNYRRANDFCSSYLWTWDAESAQNVFTAIINAYVSKQNVSTSITGGNISVTISKDWRNAKSATFLCFLCGHVHGDYHGPVPSYNGLLMLDIDTCKASVANSADESDIPTSVRTTAGNILINKVTVDFYDHTIRVERIGAQDVPARTVDTSDTGDVNDPNGNGYTYTAVTRDTITFDFNANVVETI